MSKILACSLALVCLSLTLASAEYDRPKFKKVCRADNTNDDAIYMNAQQLIHRSGFDYEEYYSIADDGYITLLVRLINPLVKKSDLRGPPVMLYHGANIDQSAYLISSSIQHFPEPYPYKADDCNCKRSSNRSLGFMLANNGYDVWLVGQRGSNELNMAHTLDVEQARADGLDFRPTQDMLAFSKTKRYWTYGLDEIIAYEIKNQVDVVKRVTGSDEVSMLSFSLSTPTTMVFLAQNPDYASKTRVYFQLAPAIAADHIFTVDRIYFEKLCPRLPTRGIGFTPTYWLKPAVRKLIIKLSKSVDIRYSLIYQFVTTLFGPSQKYNTNLERNFLAHLFQPVSFKSVQHYCQNSLTKKLTYFDYGKKENTKRYNATKPPQYDVSKLNVQKWVVISGTNDGLADTTTVARLIETTQTPTKMDHVVAPGYNHADILGGFEVDQYINLPILEHLNANL